MKRRGNFNSMQGYEEGGSDEEGGEYWRIQNISQPNTPHFCRNCMLGFRDRILLNEHLKKHYLATSVQEETEAPSREGTFRCLNCKEIFLTQEQLKLHCDTCCPHEEDAAYPCDACGKIFMGKMELDAHRVMVHERAQSAQCPHCKLVFANIQDLKVHIELDHEGHSPRKCSRRRDMYITLACDCGKVFINELNYQEHILEEHPGMEPVSWPTPDRAETRKDKQYDARDRRSFSSMREPKRKRHGNGRLPKQFYMSLQGDGKGGEGGGMCVECGETFDQLVELKRHMQNEHIHLKPYACSICGRRFTRKSDVKRHIETIHGQAVSKEDMDRIQAIRPFRCAKCGNPFGRYSDIKKHIEVHHGLPFSPDTYIYELENLDEAGLCIGSSGEAVNVRTYDCGLCKRKYRNKTTVRHHIRKDHNQEDPDSFISRSHFNHPSDLECQYCGDVFDCVDTKLEHIQSLHHQSLEPMDDLPIQQHEEIVHRGGGGDYDDMIPVKDVSTPEKQRFDIKQRFDKQRFDKQRFEKQRFDKSQIVILKQEYITSGGVDSAPLEPLDPRPEKRGDWSSSLMSDIVTETPSPGAKGTYDCPDCSRTFTRPKALQNHTLKMHGGVDEEFECEMCGKSYKHQAQFVKHLQVAHPEVGPKASSRKTVKPAPPRPSMEPVPKRDDSREEVREVSVKEVPHVTSNPTFTAAVPAQVVSSQSVSVDNMPTMEYYTCNACGTMFSSMESLTRHMNLKHKDIAVAANKPFRKETT